MRLFDGDTLRRRATAELFHDCGFDLTDEELSHVQTVLSLISAVKGMLFCIQSALLRGWAGSGGVGIGCGRGLR